ncbi:hypothetical protein [Roseococcus sp. YIM B11640]|uniref:hypothetical protein n=1 Tax=Roseococcus sp. YIM B11640 TaxID=3133973 RepID=UPI003C7DD02A
MMADPRTQIVYAPGGKVELLLREEEKNRSIPIDMTDAPWEASTLADPSVSAAVEEWVFSHDLPATLDWKQLQAILLRCDVDLHRVAAKRPKG